MGKSQKIRIRNGSRLKADQAPIESKTSVYLAKKIIKKTSFFKVRQVMVMVVGATDGNSFQKNAFLRRQCRSRLSRHFYQEELRDWG